MPTIDKIGVELWELRSGLGDAGRGVCGGVGGAVEDVAGKASRIFYNL